VLLVGGGGGGGEGGGEGGGWGGGGGATDVGNVASVLSGKGVLARPNDPVDLARALLQVLEGPQAAQLRDRLASEALERARTHFTADVCAGNFRNIYEELTSCQSIRIA